jgi:ComF family protein
MNFNIFAKNLFNFIYKPVIDTIFPPVCFLCDSMLVDDRKVVCINCWSKLKFLSNKELEDIKKVILNNNFNDIYILYDFSEEFQEIIHLLKYERCLTLGYYFAHEIVSKFNESFFLKYDAISPVPLHPIKFRERGYNQSYEIIKHLPGKKIKNILKRNKNTLSQTKLSRDERITNMINAFEFQGKNHFSNILLFDDIITTGSTLNECGKELKKCGVSQIDILCLAAPLKHAQKN